MRLTSRLFWVLVSASMPAARLIAQDYDDDPPARVARLSYIAGAVSFRPADVDDWGTATLNYPITTGDHLWADVRSRAELHIGSTAVRMGDETALSVLALDDRRVQLRMTQGQLQVRVRDFDLGDVLEIDTPNGAVTLLRPGSYRIDVDESGERATVTVRSGAAEVSTRRSTFSVRAGESATVEGSDDPRYDRYAAIPMDSWEDWCLVRDRREDHVASARYVSREMIGYEDLDAYGYWRVEVGYGPVWVPRHVARGWAPYRYGHWAWVRPWGWTWIDDAPWGFAPFHYGRWAHVRGQWVWVPGSIVRRPVYAPALVVFVGGPGWSFSVAVGNGVGWFPLAPNEPYVPVYRVSDRYRRNINITNVHVTNINITNVNVTNINYRNRAVPGAVTAVSHDVFVGARPVGRSAIVVRERDVQRARVIGAAPRVEPRRESRLARADWARNVHRPPQAVEHRSVVERRTIEGRRGPVERAPVDRSPQVRADDRRQLDDRGAPDDRRRADERREIRTVPDDRPARDTRQRDAERSVQPSRSVEVTRPAPAARRTSDPQPSRDVRPAPSVRPTTSDARPSSEMRRDTRPDPAPEAPRPGAEPQPGRSVERREVVQAPRASSRPAPAAREERAPGSDHPRPEASRQRGNDHSRAAHEPSGDSGRTGRRGRPQ